MASSLLLIVCLWYLGSSVRIQIVSVLCWTNGGLGNLDKRAGKIGCWLGCRMVILGDVNRECVHAGLWTWAMAQAQVYWAIQASHHWHVWVSLCLDEMACIQFRQMHLKSCMPSSTCTQGNYHSTHSISTSDMSICAGLNASQHHTDGIYTDDCNGHGTRGSCKVLCKVVHDEKVWQQARACK